MCDIKEFKINNCKIYIEGDAHFKIDHILSQYRELHYKNGILHYDNGPATIRNNGDIAYYHDGLLDRKDGPAVITNKRETWYTNGVKNRIDGPAEITKGTQTNVYFNGEELIKNDSRYFANGKEYRYEQWKEIVGYEPTRNSPTKQERAMKLINELLEIV